MKRKLAMRQRKKPVMLPLRAAVCLRQRDALLLRPLPKKALVLRREWDAMFWEHRAMDILYRDPAQERYPEPVDDQLADAADPTHSSLTSPPPAPK